MSRAGTDAALLGRDLVGAPTLAEFIERLAQTLESHGLCYGHGTDNARDEAYALVFAALGLDFADSDAMLHRPPPARAIDVVAPIAARRVNERLPLPYLTGEAWFAGLRFMVDRRVFIPRSPLAELIGRGYAPWLRHDGETRILDMCTGSGCIAIASALYLAGSRASAVDSSAPALEVARRNAELHGVTDRVKMIQSDLFAGLAGNRYDLIVCNPPYVAAGRMADLPLEYGYEPKAALQAGDDGLAVIDRLLRECYQYLADDAILIVEVGESAAAVRRRYSGLPFIWLEFEHGGEGVFVLHKQDLKGMHDGKSKNG